MKIFIVKKVNTLTRIRSVSSNQSGRMTLSQLKSVGLDFDRSEIDSNPSHRTWQGHVTRTRAARISLPYWKNFDLNENKAAIRLKKYGC